ncbi:TBCC domain-containing protein 1, partial [Linum grandiflorum]
QYSCPYRIPISLSLSPSHHFISSSFARRSTNPKKRTKKNQYQNRKVTTSPLEFSPMADAAEPPATTSTSDANPPPTTTPSPTSAAASASSPQIHPRREPFEHGLLPIPKLIFPDPTQTLGQLRQKLSSKPRVDAAALADALQISTDHARLVLDTLASVLHSESDPLVKAGSGQIDSVGADLRDLILFLYIQSYKKLLPRTHKDSAAVADVWPSTSAFDGYLSALSPLQLVRSNSRRFMPSHADEEAHQLSYLQKHMGNILSLLAEPVEGDGEGEIEESLVLTMEGFEHLGFLIQIGEHGSERVSLSQATPFFANSDPDMPAVPVPASEVLDWITENISSALETITERISAKENGPSSASDQDIAMADTCNDTVKTSPSSRGTSFIEGVSKSSCVKQTSDLKGSSLKVLNCHESSIYILAPLRYATVYGCSDSTIVLGAVGKAVRIEHCERVHVITAARRVCIANCRECVFFLGVNQRPLMVGDNHKLHVAPYNTFYSDLEVHMAEAGVEATINKWDEPLALGVVDPHDSLSHPAGVSDVQAETATRIDPDHFTNFLIPNWFGGESSGMTKDNPFPLPDSYMESHVKNLKNLDEIKQLLRETPLEESRKRELSCALHMLFKDWLYASGNIRQLYCLQAD